MQGRRRLNVSVAALPKNARQMLPAARYERKTARLLRRSQGRSRGVRRRPAVPLILGVHLLFRTHQIGWVFIVLLSRVVSHRFQFRKLLHQLGVCYLTRGLPEWIATALLRRQVRARKCRRRAEKQRAGEDGSSDLRHGRFSKINCP
jgi:hypothetical protein